MNCKNKTKYTCASTSYATCTMAEVTPNIQSELSGEDCLDINQTTQDIYSQIESILDQSDLSGLGQNCDLNYTLEEGKLFIKNALLAQEAEICSLRNRVQELETIDICNKSIVDCNFDFGTLTDQCNAQPATMGAVIQVILDKLNTL